MEQVLPEHPLLHGFREITIRCGNDPDIDLDGLYASKALEFHFLENAQNLRLRSRIHVADFVEEDRALIRELEFPELSFNRAGECAFFETDEFAFQQALRDTGTVQFHHRLVFADRKSTRLNSSHQIISY